MIVHVWSVMVGMFKSKVWVLNKVYFLDLVEIIATLHAIDNSLFFKRVPIFWQMSMKAMMKIVRTLDD